MSAATDRIYEDRLGDGLEIVLADGARDLAAIADGLNAINVTGPRGERWEADTLGAALQRLAAAT